MDNDTTHSRVTSGSPESPQARSERLFADWGNAYTAYHSALKTYNSEANDDHKNMLDNCKETFDTVDKELGEANTALVAHAQSH